MNKQEFHIMYDDSLIMR